MYSRAINLSRGLEPHQGFILSIDMEISQMIGPLCAPPLLR